MQTELALGELIHTPHTKDSDCTIGAYGCCIECGVGVFEPCADCGQSRYHAPTCPEVTDYAPPNEN